MNPTHWRAHQSGKILDRKDNEIAHVFMFKHLPLVAAAPAMLEALQFCYDWFENDALMSEACASPMRKARAAIDQAGPQPTEPPRKLLPDTFVEAGLALAKDVNIFGAPIETLSRDELLAACAQGWKALRDAQAAAGIVAPY